LQLEHSFTVPVGIDDAWKVLLDIERVAPCMPGAALETVHGDDFTGTVKVKLGPIALTYKGKASFVEKDEAAHRATIHAQGRDARGNGTASAKVTATLTDQSGETKVDVVTDLDITGKPAQFGRGVMVDVGNKLIGQFADCLAGKLSGDGAAEPAGASAGAGSAEAAAPPTTPTAKKTTAAKKAPAKSATAAKKAPAKKPAAAKKTAAAASSAPAASAPVDKTPPATPPSTPPSTPSATPSTNGAEAAAAAEAAPAPTEAAVPTPTTAADPAPAAPVAPAAPTTPAAHDGPRRIAPTEVEPIDLLEHAGPAVAKRLAPIVVLIVLLLIILRLRKR
jgi:carbon monoxide dehydrogenase subunit G